MDIIKKEGPISLLDLPPINLYSTKPKPLFDLGEPAYKKVNCGELRKDDEDLLVEIAGKVTKKKVGRFIEICDHFGSTQLIAGNDNQLIIRRFLTMPMASYIRVIGIVRLRKTSDWDETIGTGQIEVHVKEIVNVLTRSSAELIPTGEKRGYSEIPQNINPDRAITTLEFQRVGSENLLHYFSVRKLTCGELRIADVGKDVELVGWLDKKHGKYLQIRDGYGYTQATIDLQKQQEFKAQVSGLNEFSIVLVKGNVAARPKPNVNVGSKTGEIEVVIEELTILDPTKPYGKHNCSKLIKLDLQNFHKADGESFGNVNLYTTRTRNCGELKDGLAGNNVILCGWLDSAEISSKFTLRDCYGSVEICIPEELTEKYDINSIPFESALKVEGVVVKTAGQARIEVHLKHLEILNVSKNNLPIQIKGEKGLETERIANRFLDLRRKEMQTNLRTRSKVSMKMREYLINYAGFIEVETPTLTRKCPLNAEEFIVPGKTRGSFYSLATNPLHFNQMLMVGGMDRCFQISRSYKNATDVQPELSFLNISLSFTDREKIISLVEEILANSWPNSREIKTPFPILTYSEAMAKYGTDEPDLRYDLQLINITSQISLNPKFISCVEDFAAYAIVVKNPNGKMLPENLKTNFDEIAEKYVNAKFLSSKISTETIAEWINGPLGNLLSVQVTNAFAKKLLLEPGDLLVFSCGNKFETQTMMGEIREIIMESLEDRELVPQRSNESSNFIWIVDFPLFYKENETGYVKCTHSVSTAPHPDDFRSEIFRQDKDILKIRSLSYNLVLNGEEIGRGSIQIHDPKMQKQILTILHHDHDLQFLLDALEYGAPPHGLFSIQIDKLISIICNTSSVLDVIAFPKCEDGVDPLIKAPTSILEQELKSYHINIVPEQLIGGGYGGRRRY